MHELAEAVAKVCRDDPRYAFDAYFFVFEALNFAHKTLGLGQDRSDCTDAGDADAGNADAAGADADEIGESRVDANDRPLEVPADYDETSAAERHLTGQQLCEAIRLYALEQYGLMAKCVLNNWGIEKTDDFGNIVFNLIDAGQMRKTPDDKHEDFDDNFDFEVGLCQSFKITSTE